MKTSKLSVNAKYVFPNNPVDFIPNMPNLGVVSIAYTATGNVEGQSQVLCQNHIFIDFAGMAGLWDGGPGPEVAGESVARMSVAPNPAGAAAEVRYAVEDLSGYGGGTIKLYSLDGTLLADQKVTEAQGRVHFDLNGLASGAYVVVFFSEGRRIGQQTFIKE